MNANIPTGQVGRRALIGMAGASAGTAAGLLMGAEPALAVQPVGPWTYVAPGESIQATLNAGSRAIMLGDGEYAVSAPVVLRAGVTIAGIGQRTRIRASTAMAEVFTVGGGGPIDGVCVSGLAIDAAGKASTGINLHIQGTTGNYKGEPDSVCRIDNVWVYDAVQDGIAYQGEDTQACITSRVRVRRAGRYGFRVEAPDNWWIACESTTSTQTGSSAGFYCAGANNFFLGCKAWYCRDYGFHVKGTRNKFVGCEAQDIRSHGFYVEWDKNIFTGCSADTCGYGAVGGTPATADGFYVVGGDATSMVGCQSFDRRPGGAAAQQRYGFNVPASMSSSGRLSGASGWDNAGGLIHQR